MAVPSRLPQYAARLRHLWHAEPYMPEYRIAALLGIGTATLHRWSRTLDLPSRAARSHAAATGVSRGPYRPRRRTIQLQPSGTPMRRCLACGGRITASVRHACRAAEPLTTGLVWTRGAA